jgi:hypothetical protein
MLTGEILVEEVSSWKVLFKKVAQDIVTSKRHKNMTVMASRYHKWCEQHQFCQEANYNNVAAFLLSYVLNNKGSTRSVHLILGLLKRYFKLKGKSWLTKSESYIE